MWSKTLNTYLQSLVINLVLFTLSVLFGFTGCMIVFGTGVIYCFALSVLTAVSDFFEVATA